MDRIKGINSKHRILVREHLKFLQSRLYDLTEYDKTKGKFLDFVDVVLGGKVGTCQLQKDGEDVSTPDTSESDCAEESMKHECRIILTGLVVNTPQAICELNPLT